MDGGPGGAWTGVVWGIDGFRSSTFPTELPSLWLVTTVDLSSYSMARSTTILISAAVLAEGTANPVPKDDLGELVRAGVLESVPAHLLAS
jgi:hypothetical protein